jgi:hypothetical protein
MLFLVHDVAAPRPAASNRTRKKRASVRRALFKGLKC